MIVPNQPDPSYYSMRVQDLLDVLNTLPKNDRIFIEVDNDGWTEAFIVNALWRWEARQETYIVATKY